MPAKKKPTRKPPRPPRKKMQEDSYPAASYRKLAEDRNLNPSDRQRKAKRRKKSIDGPAFEQQNPRATPIPNQRSGGQRSVERIPGATPWPWTGQKLSGRNRYQ